MSQSPRGEKVNAQFKNAQVSPLLLHFDAIKQHQWVKLNFLAEPRVTPPSSPRWIINLSWP